MEIQVLPAAVSSIMAMTKLRQMRYEETFRAKEERSFQPFHDLYFACASDANEQLHAFNAISMSIL
ncbi:hypothetical protein KIPB_013885, partial [Kipferlia bialata]|eukprot:g13885.t1